MVREARAGGGYAMIPLVDLDAEVPPADDPRRRDSGPYYELPAAGSTWRQMPPPQAATAAQAWSLA